MQINISVLFSSFYWRQSQIFHLFHASLLSFPFSPSSRLKILLSNLIKSNNRHDWGSKCLLGAERVLLFGVFRPLDRRRLKLKLILIYFDVISFEAETTITTKDGRDLLITSLTLRKPGKSFCFENFVSLLSSSSFLLIQRRLKFSDWGLCTWVVAQLDWTVNEAVDVISSNRKLSSHFLVITKLAKVFYFQIK